VFVSQYVSECSELLSFSNVSKELMEKAGRFGQFGLSAAVVGLALTEAAAP
jgi:hypothetical protein